MTTRRIPRAALLGAEMAVAGTAKAQDKYPNRPVELVVTCGPGGGADAMGRKMSQLLEKQLGVPFPVSDIGGASGNAGLTKVPNSAPDGYTAGTLIALTVSCRASGLGTAKPEDFAIVAVTQDSPSMLFVPTDSPFKDRREPRSARRRLFHDLAGQLRQRPDDLLHPSHQRHDPRLRRIVRGLGADPRHQGQAGTPARFAPARLSALSAALQPENIR